MDYQETPVRVVARSESFESYRYDGTRQHAEHIRNWIRGHNGRAAFNGNTLTVSTPLGPVPLNAGDTLIHVGGNNFWIMLPGMFDHIFRTP